MSKKLLALVFGAMFSLSLVGCEQDDGPVEEAAEAVESAGDAIEDAAD